MIQAEHDHVHRASLLKSTLKDYVEVSNFNVENSKMKDTAIVIQGGQQRIISLQNKLNSNFLRRRSKCSGLVLNLLIETRIFVRLSENFLGAQVAKKCMPIHMLLLEDIRMVRILKQ